MASTLVRGQPCCKSPKNKKQKKLQKNPFIFSNYIPNNYQVYHCVFSPIEEETFIFCMLWFCKHIILPHVVIKSCNLAFAFPNMVLEIIEFRNQKFFFAFNLHAITKFHHMHLPIRINPNFHPCLLPRHLETFSLFPIPLTFFFFFSGLDFNFNDGSEFNKWLAT
jgi:hypothetical protein